MNNLLSFSSVKLDLFSEDGVPLKPASGFVVETGNQYHLITNLHVISDGEKGIKPCLLKTSIHIHGGGGEKRAPLWMGVRKKITIPLYDDNDLPRWIDLRAHGESIISADVAALPVQEDSTLRLFSGKIPGIFDDKGSWEKNKEYRARISAIPISAVETEVEYHPPDAVHIVGLPLGWKPEGDERSSSAFWHTSFLASEMYEPGMHRANIFFIDRFAPEGMTGSPVVGLKDDLLKFLGVYSDHRMSEFGANAGLVYEPRLVKELLEIS